MVKWKKDKRTDNTMVKWKKDKRTKTTNNTLHRKLKIEQHENREWTQVIRIDVLFAYSGIHNDAGPFNEFISPSFNTCLTPLFNICLNIYEHLKSNNDIIVENN
jgi:hypothetical protein